MDQSSSCQAWRHHKQVHEETERIDQIFDWRGEILEVYVYWTDVTLTSSIKEFLLNTVSLLNPILPGGGAKYAPLLFFLHHPETA